MKKYFFLFLFLKVSLIYSAPYSGTVRQFKQPDGSFVDLKLFGTEYYMRAEGLDNYTLFRDPNTKWICYAKLSDDGTQLQSTGIIYKGQTGKPNSLQSNLNLPYHLDITSDARMKIIKQNKKLLNENSSNLRMSSGNGSNLTNGTPVNNVIGNIYGLCIVVDFPDEPGVIPMNEFEDFCNSMNYTNYGNNGSLRKFYSDISNGLVDYQNVVYGYYHAPHTFAYYDSLPFGYGARQVLSLSLRWIDSLGFDFSTLSINSDSSIKAINLVYTGNPAGWSQGMWYHSGSYTGFSADGVHSNSYNTSDASSTLSIGTVCHENGHMICNWPDTYKYDGSPDGIGNFDLMCSYGSSYNPTPPNPLFRSNAGWEDFVDVTNYNGLIHDTVNTFKCFRYNNINDTNEFFILENRTRTGRSTFISDQGLTIWHINRNGDNQTINHEVFLEHADNNIFSEDFACFKNGSFPEFNHTTIPNSDWNNGDPSGLKVWEIADPDSILTYRLGNEFDGASLNIQYLNFANDNNANGFIESGESVDININSLNNGQLSSSLNTIISCTAVGINAQYITVNTNPSNVGVINSLQIVPGVFNISIQQATPLGSIFNLLFELADSTDTAFVTKSFIVGKQVIMANDSSSSCGSVFYDSGILNNYNDMQDFEKTIFPANNGTALSVKFIKFELEEDPNCAYDYLRIYNGPTTASTLIGEYCGFNSPDSVVSTDPGGALTFKFHSDEGVTGAGWEAHIDCVPFLNVNDLSANAFSISPNPTNGELRLHANSIEYYSLYDMYGRLVEESGPIKVSDIKLDLSDRSSGIYLLKFKSGGNNYCKKVILKSK